MLTRRQRLVRARLDKLGKDQRWLAGEVGISENHLSQILSGAKNGSADVLDRIAEAVNLDLRTLVRAA